MGIEFNSSEKFQEWFDERLKQYLKERKIEIEETLERVKKVKQR